MPHAVLADSTELTMRCRQSLRFAQEEAEQFGHNYVGTEHLLLGLIRDDDSGLFDRHGLTATRIRPAIALIIGQGASPRTDVRELTPRAALAMDAAAEEASARGTAHTDTQHLLHAIVSANESVAYGLLRSLGIHPDALLHDAADQDAARATSEHWADSPASRAEDLRNISARFPNPHTPTPHPWWLRPRVLGAIAAAFTVCILVARFIA